MTILVLALFGLIAASILAEVISAVRASRRPSEPADGCCGCGAVTADVVLKCGETYCWTCVETWPAEAEPLAELGMTIFPGRERSPR